ncbi:M1 family metallopeptidase [Niabella yanshanensis]|uniref:M1 family metallopeptidase n=1 Tax=Niabella yanshanensis TaxID=577386 RepID=A0ABZ0W8B7_9BACT|nr:M1 family metallopeptidase [Niabella yanshanensis]WQD39441.1 M1 family metallopeptidase [Niabella yanshanensis]
MIRKLATVVLAGFWGTITFAQQGYWQQKVKYVMDVDMDVQSNQLTGKQKLEYWNNSPDTLKKVFYHLYWNAFQPGSMMDNRSRRQGEISINGKPDWDPRVRGRIDSLAPNEIGYQRVKSLKMNGVPQKFEELETILMVPLTKAILPGQKVVLDMEFEAQVPLQIRRSGRDNPTTKVRYSMSQWYPRICAYDKAGWHPTPYVGREFYGPFGEFEVNICIDRNYILGGTGYLKNANQIGFGYESPGVTPVIPATDKLTWKFTASNVHDFMWAADPDFIHKTRQIKDGITLHLLYKTAGKKTEDWEQILTQAEKAYPFMEKQFGAYPYKQYSFITGGDGGMEYPMATLLASPGAWLHEWFHSWYQGVLATNESLYPWMDEGFTSYGENIVSVWLKNGNRDTANLGDYNSYYKLARSNFEEPLATHADHFNTNAGYSIASYSKGAVFLEQLGYIVGATPRDKILLDYYNTWKFKHPTVDDFIRIAEKVSDMKLDWYKEFWVNSIKTIDYAIDNVREENGKINIRLRNKGLIPMPVDLVVTREDGKQELYYIPMDLMYGAKPEENATPRKTYPVWRWTSETYVITTDLKKEEIATIEIDPSQRMADVNRQNNKQNF